MYIFTKISIESYEASFGDIRTVHDRGICLTKLFYYAREDVLTGKIA